MDDSSRYMLLKLLHENPQLSQRELARHMEISLGKVNYCLRALIDIGAIKVKNFQNSKNKTAYFYKLTPAGMEEKTQVTKRFLKRKLAEYQEIEQQITELEADVSVMQE